MASFHTTGSNSNAESIQLEDESERISLSHASPTGSYDRKSNRTIDLNQSMSYLHTRRNVQRTIRKEKMKKSKSLRDELLHTNNRRAISLHGKGSDAALNVAAARDAVFGKRALSDRGTEGYGATAQVDFLLKKEISKQSIPEQTIPEQIDETGSERTDEPITTTKALIQIICGKGIVSLCLLAIPFALLSVYLDWSATSVFWLNFIVMIPLASILGDFTEEVALHTNETIGGLINASFGNAVEVVIGIQALLANEIRVVQASMLGSIFSNLLLVLGCCFFFGGLYHKEQYFNVTAASANMGLLALSSIALVLPTPFAEYYDLHDEHALLVSRIAAVFLIFMYVQLLVFQLKTHAYIFNAGDGDDDGEELAVMSMGVACVGLLVVTLLVALFSEFLVGSIEGFTEASGVSRTFVGIIILPIVGNAVEHVTAVTVSIKDKMDLAMGIAVGSCTQISLFVAPLTVLVGWICGKDMTLNFPHFEIVLYILSVFTVSVVVSNPQCNWLEGSLLITTYALIAVGFWFENVRSFT